MNTISQSFFDQQSTSRTHLACVAWVHKHYLPTGAFCLVGCVIRELVPRHVTNAFVEFMTKHLSMIAHHARNVEFFKGDNLKHIYQMSGKFMREIVSSVGNFFMNTRNFFALFCSAGCPLNFLAQPSLRFGKSNFIGFKKSWIGNLFTSRERGKRRKANINTDSFVRGRKWLELDFTRETGVPFIVRPTKSNGLDGPFDVPVQFNSDIADILDVKLPVFQLDTIPISRECDRIEAIPSFEAGESWGVASFDAAKECLKRFIQSSQNILRSGKIQIGDPVIKAPNFFKRVGLVVVIDRLVPLFIAENPLLKGAIIQKASRIKHIVKRGLLRVTGEQSVFIGFAHLLSFLIRNIFFNRRFAYVSYCPRIITSAPKGGQPGTQRRKFLSQYSAAIAFQPIHYLGYSPAGIKFKKQVNMIRHDFERMNRHFKFVSFLIQQYGEFGFNITRKYWTPIFRTPHYV